METSHGYEGMSLLLSCQVVKGQVQGHIEFVRPDGHIVMRCDNGSVSATCTTVVTGYTTVVTSYKTHAVHAAQYVMNITQFHSSVDVGMWLCRDSTANTPGASVNITSPCEYSYITHHICSRIHSYIITSHLLLSTLIYNTSHLL